MKKRPRVWRWVPKSLEEAAEKEARDMLAIMGTLRPAANQEDHTHSASSSEE